MEYRILSLVFLDLTKTYPNEYQKWYIFTYFCRQNCAHNGRVYTSEKQKQKQKHQYNLATETMIAAPAIWIISCIKRHQTYRR